MPLEGATPLIAARGVGKRFAGRDVLAHVDLAVRAGEIVALIGPNGAGKTTLIKIMLGLMAPDAGRVERDAALRIGYVPQNLTIDPLLPLTVRRFLALARARTGDPVAVLTETGVAHAIDAAIQDLSGGELRRVLLARALMGEPQLLVLDEPVQGVDVAGQAALHELIAGLRARRGLGVLIVSHDLHFVLAATDRVVCLNGHVCCTGRPEEVGRDPAYRALFGDAPGLALYAHHHDHEHDAAGHAVPHRHG